MPSPQPKDDDTDAVEQSLLGTKDETGEVIELDDEGPAGKKPGDKQAAPNPARPEEEDGEDDGRLANRDEHAPEDPQRPHLTSAERRARQRAARQRNETELRFLRQRNENLERQVSQFAVDVDARLARSEFTYLGSAISNVEENIRKADDVIAKAVAAGAGEDVTEAMNIKSELQARRNALLDEQSRVRLQHQQVQRARQQAQRPPVPEAPDPEVVRMANAWTARNAWVAEDPEEEAFVKIVDAGVANSGYDPRTREYWDELDARLAKRLPHRYQRQQQQSDDDAGSPPARQPAEPRGPRMPTAGRQPALKPNEVHVSADRRKALEDLGVWDIPELRNKYLKRYAQYDREAAEKR